VVEIISVIGTAITIAAAIASGSGEPVTLTWYGSESDGCLGARHGASWHGDACGLPEVVDLESFGCAAPRWVPYCSKLVVCRGEHCVVVTVVDRQADDLLGGRWHVDLWPAAARELGIVELGITEGWVWRAEIRD